MGLFDGGGSVLFTHRGSAAVISTATPGAGVWPKEATGRPARARSVRWGARAPPLPSSQPVGPEPRMEGRGPYRIYDPGGSAPPGDASAAAERLAENSRLKEKTRGEQMPGELLGESQLEASRLRQKAEELAKGSEPPSPPPPCLPCPDRLAALTGHCDRGEGPRDHPGGRSREEGEAAGAAAL
ncbi:PREDICTED: atherin-like [Condylura cristata]|uniref:atherin-like n=1 Tax=Condylura cristata TaxID=143302 RepID=UPI000642CA0B|nr:PREDICTED: atherin-like [Condylura cristata]